MNTAHAEARRTGKSGSPVTKEWFHVKEAAVRSVKVLAIAVGLLLACAGRPAPAGSVAPEADPAPAADTSLRRAPAAVAGTTANADPSGTDAAPPPAEIAALRERVDKQSVRVFLSQDAYDIHGAGFDSRGVAFAPGDLRGVPAWDNGGSNSDFTRPAPLPSPIGWARIDRIETREPAALRGALRGALVGGLIGTAACAALFAWANQSNEELGPGVLALFALPPLGALVVGTIGAFGQHSVAVWQRDRDRSPSAPGAPR
jgi:hypothetical protein